MLCEACFLGHFASRYTWSQSFDPMTSSNLTFDGGQVKVRSRSGQIFKSMFLQKKHMFLAQNFLRIPNMVFVFLYDARRNPKNCRSKNDVIISSLYITNTFLCGTFVCGNCLLIQSIQKHSLNTRISSRRVECYTT